MAAVSPAKDRLKALRAAMKREGLDAMLVSTRVSSLYLSQFPSSNSIILVTPREAIFLTDFRYMESATAQIKDFDVRRITQHATSELQDLLKKLGPKTIGFEGQVSFDEFQKLKKAVGRAKLVEAGHLIKQLRAVKSDAEIRTIAANQRINEEILNDALMHAREGMSELELQTYIRIDMLKRGVGEAFDSIIATGANSSLPHANPGKKPLKKGDYLLIDMGVRKNFYHSDMTRTYCFGWGSDRQREVYEVVLAAQLAALKKIRAGVPCVEVDAAARNLITEAGYGEYFGHGLGHGVGLEIHEGPTLNPRSSDVLEAGMVVTVEPGIYLPGFGGVRIEDLVVVTDRGFRNLTKQSKAFQVL